MKDISLVVFRIFLRHKRKEIVRIKNVSLVSRRLVKYTSASTTWRTSTRNSRDRPSKDRVVDSPLSCTRTHVPSSSFFLFATAFSYSLPPPPSFFLSRFDTGDAIRLHVSSLHAIPHSLSRARAARKSLIRRSKGSSKLQSNEAPTKEDS